MGNKKVTIIIITLNRDSLKDACEDNQSYRNYHHIVLGDGVLPTLYDSEKRTTLGFSKIMGITEPGANMPNGSPNPIQRWALKNLDLKVVNGIGNNYPVSKIWLLFSDGSVND